MPKLGYYLMTGIYAVLAVFSFFILPVLIVVGIVLFIPTLLLKRNKDSEWLKTLVFGMTRFFLRAASENYEAAKQAVE